MSLTIASQPNQLLYVAPKIEMKNKNGTKQGVCVCVCVRKDKGREVNREGHGVRDCG